MSPLLAAHPHTAHYDRITIVFHWLTAFLVLGLFNVPTLIAIDHEQCRFIGVLRRMLASR